HHITRKDVRRFTTELQCDRNDILTRILHDEPSCCRLTCKCNLVNILMRRKRLSRFCAKTVYYIENTLWHDILNEFHKMQNRCRCLFSRFQNDGVARCKCRCNLPGSHQQREVPWNDLSDHPEWFMEMVRNSIYIIFANTASFSTDDANDLPE